MVPRKNAAEPLRQQAEGGCRFELVDGELLFDCQGCEAVMDAPSVRCMPSIRCALERHIDAKGMVLQGEQHVWVREKGLESLRSALKAERSWDEFRSTIRELPCFRPLPMDRVSRYLEKARDGRRELFCKGEGARCDGCLLVQERALDALRSDRRRMMRMVAADRFRITDVKGGSQ